MFVERTSPSTHIRSRFPLHPSLRLWMEHPSSGKVKQLLEKEDCKLRDPKNATMLLMHTGSPRILDGLCEQFRVSPDSPSVASSYNILREYGNTIGCSIPLMLADPVHRGEGEGLIIAFGLSFSCGVCTLTIPREGWTP